MTHTPEQIAAFKARLKRGLVYSDTHTPAERKYYIRQGMFADLRQAGTLAPEIITTPTITSRPAEPVELSALLNQQEHIRAELAYLHNKLMEKRAEEKQGDSKLDFQGEI